MQNENYALVIEDSVSMRNFVSAILRQETGIGHVIEAEDPNQALTLLAQQTGQLALIISDWNMPGMPLETFIQKLQDHPMLARAPIFLLTAASNEQAQQVAVAIRARGILTKPFAAEDLIGLISTHLGITERRRAPRVVPLTRCEVDLGFDSTQPSYPAEVINLSATGVLVRSPTPAPGMGCIYDFVSLLLMPEDGEPIKVYGQVVRIQADPEVIRHRGDTVLMAFDFGRIDATTMASLQHYIALNVPCHPSAQHHS